MATVKKPYGPQYRDAIEDLAIGRGAKGAKLNVLRAILKHCNSATGQAFPGNAKIMKHSNVTSKGTLDIALRWLRENGIIRATAYETGGHGRAVVWAFGLPAWSTPETAKTALKTGEVPEEINLPENRNEPPRKSERTSPKIGEPTKLTKLTPEGAPSGPDVSASRGQPFSPSPNPALPQNETEHALFDEWCRGTGTYGEAVAKLDEWRRRQAA